MAAVKVKAAKVPVLTVPPIAQPAVAQYAILRASLDLAEGVEVLHVQPQDANGLAIGEPLLVHVDAAAATALAQITPQLYADLQTALGITGTVG
jgi:hypothetical protein